MDKLDAEIEKTRKELADLKRKVEARETELRALVKAAELRPEPAASPTVEREPKRVRLNAPAPESGPADPTLPPGTITVERRGGRQPGAISKQWRNVLDGIYAEGKNRPHDVGAISLLAESAGLDLQVSSVLARMKNYVELGYVEEVNGHYRVTPTAIEKFELRKQPEE